MSAGNDTPRPQSMKLLIEETLADGQAEDVVYLPAERQSGGLFVGIVVATARSARHAAALSDRLARALKSGGYKRAAVEATETREWTLLDCGDIVVHIMQAEARDRYRLEALWAFEEDGGGDGVAQ